MKLYNTLTRKKEEFKSLKPKKVGIYSCGPTVYNYAHIGNLRSYIFADILCRTLEYNNYKVKQVINITDVGRLVGDADDGEDKLELASRKEKKDIWQLADFFTEQFKKDITALNIQKPIKWAVATKHIKEQIALIKILEKKGFTYKVSDGIYFDTFKLKDCGKLSGQSLNEKKAGARVKFSDEKKNLSDFALWKFSPKDKKRQMEWSSPWGVGFPGWHIECSAMSREYLGQPFDIHTGGIDHIAVHHTNEIAQSESAYSKPLAKYWMHNEFVIFGKEKLSKSKGNFITLNNLVEKNFHPLSYRYLALQTHYRKPINFSFKALQSAQNSLVKLWQDVAKLDKPKGCCLKLEKKFLNAINDDLNTPEALAVVWETLKSKNFSSAKMASLLKFDKVLQLNIDSYRKGQDKFKKEKISKNIQELAKKRDEARKNKDWRLADKLRMQIEKEGYEVEDTVKGTKIIKKL